MLCIQQGSDGEITRDLVTQMFYVSSNSTVVAKKLVRKYPFMKDVGNKVSGFVSFKLIMHNYTERISTVRQFTAIVPLTSQHA